MSLSTPSPCYPTCTDSTHRSTPRGQPARRRRFRSRRCHDLRERHSPVSDHTRLGLEQQDCAREQGRLTDPIAREHPIWKCEFDAIILRSQQDLPSLALQLLVRSALGLDSTGRSGDRTKVGDMILSNCSSSSYPVRPPRCRVANAHLCLQSCLLL